MTLTFIICEACDLVTIWKMETDCFSWYRLSLQVFHKLYKIQVKS